jgi:hypothetical protein
VTIQQLLQNPWAGFVGTVLGVLGVALSIVFYLRSRRIQRPTYAKRSIRWFDGSDTPHSDLKMYFRDQQIQRFTITHLAFWNAGNQTIRKGDFATASPLRLHIPSELTLLDIRVTARTTSENSVLVIPPAVLPSHPASDIHIDFDFFDANDGFAVQLVHDGESTKDITLLGKLPGAPSIEQVGPGGDVSRSFARVRSSFFRGSSRPFLRTPWFIKYVFMPISGLSLGSIGFVSLYYMIWREFHWYQPFGLIFLVYLLLPFAMFEREPPFALIEGIESSKQTKT